MQAASIGFPAFDMVNGGGRLPEDLSRDSQWLEVWNDPRAQEVMALYRSNIAAYRRGE